jgi:hypothetical protein
VLLGPAEETVPPLPDAVPEAIDIPIVPSPVMLEIVTVLLVIPLPLTAILPVAVPVVFNVTSAAARETDVALLYVIV